MSLHSYIQGFISDPTTVINVLTNGSGVSQALSIWDVNIVAAVGWSAAGFTRNNSILAVNGIAVVEVPVILSATDQIADLSISTNLEGFEYAFPAASNMTFTVGAGATFWSYAVHVVYDVVTGS